ncbi:MAG: hypothetical protein H7338_03540 [Candidatus Sericytochromatia bacterium]|nr:hypothetical protein [Candidatus Sericytochromatia bacterium]
MSASTSIDLEEVPGWPDLITDPLESTELFGAFVIDAIERLRLVEEMEHLVEGTVNRMDEGMSAALDFTDESLEALDEIIGEGFSRNLDEETSIVEVIDDLVMDLGAYLGLLIVENLGGEWRFREDIWHASIFFPRIGAECYPFHRVARRLVVGKDDSLALFYDGLLDVLEVQD